MSLKNEILTLTDLKHEIIEVRGKKLLIQEMTGIERDKISRESLDGKGEFDEEKFTTNLIANCVRDPETKKRVFKPDDVIALRKLSWQVSQPINDAVVRINGLGEGELRAAEKN